MIFCIYFSEFLWKYNLSFNALSRFTKLLFYFELNIFRLVEQKELITALIHNFQRLLSWTTFLKNCRSWSFSFMTSTVVLVMSNQQISWEKWNVRWGRYEISYILRTNTIISYFVILKNIIISNVLMVAHSCQKDFE